MRRPINIGVANLRKIIELFGVLQIDSVNVLVRRPLPAALFVPGFLPYPVAWRTRSPFSNIGESKAKRQRRTSTFIAKANASGELAPAFSPERCKNYSHRVSC